MLRWDWGWSSLYRSPTMPDEDSLFDSAAAFYVDLVCSPDPDAQQAVLHPGALDPPQRWRPPLRVTDYTPTDPAGLGLDGVDDFHALSGTAPEAAIRCVVAREGPVHFNVLGDRLLTAAGAGRMGSRIRGRMEEGLAAMVDHGTLADRAPFYGTTTQFLAPPLRDWSPLPDSIRDLDHVAETELMAALVQAVLEAGEPLDPRDAMNNGIARIGFPRLTASARERLATPLADVENEGMLIRRDGHLRLGREVFCR